MSTYHCTSCGRAIFRSDAILRRVTLSRMGDHVADCFAIREAIDADALTRYDVSLHEGWYCCRFIMMRMTVDKFGTGDDLLVYADSVVEVPDGAQPVPRGHGGAIKLTRDDYDAVILAPENRDQLLVVKLGAIWCPPCRHMDAIISKLSLPGVKFFDLDIDEQQEIAARFNNGAVPFFVFYKNGSVLGTRMGAMPARAFTTLLQSLATVALPKAG